MDDIKISSNRNFGIVFFIVFLIIALYPLIFNENIRLWSLIISLVFLILGLINSKILTPLNKIWFKFGILLGNIISPIIMLLIYILTFVPTKIYFIITNKDPMKIKYDKEVDTYWVDRKKKLEPMDKQY